MDASPLVGILMGSDSDLQTMTECASVLEDFGIAYELNVLSAHRSPHLAAEYATSARERGLKVLVCGAGRAAHLAGVIAAHTTLPVLGVPIDGGPLNGVDALYATVQMPPGIPVGTLAIGSHGARNAGILAAQILALSDDALAEKLVAYKKSLEEGVAKKNRRLQETGWKHYNPA
ncbi:5-(carboxyamino)imidazole ribonucleotide mutase [Candidatus Poribacteria bacterium]|nr:5-(carboxyamino)imidazole ribonucleotide mutase [Candidatus Poribacteria bacterium]